MKTISTFHNALSIAGNWFCRLDPERRGFAEKWYNAPMEGHPVVLPGTTQTNGIGQPHTKRLIGNLTPSTNHVGPAWYQRSIEFSTDNCNHHVEIFLERCSWQTFAWLNGTALGTRDSLVSPHIYDLSGAIKPGTNQLTIMVDNSNQKGEGFAPTADGTQGEDLVLESDRCRRLNCGGHHTVFGEFAWNGITGRMELQVRDRVRISELQVHSLVEVKTIQLQLTYTNDLDIPFPATISYVCRTTQSHTPDLCAAFSLVCEPGQHLIVHELVLGHAMRLWDEFDPEVYQLAATLLTVHGEDVFLTQFDEPTDNDTLAYLQQEALRILSTFGNHPSFCMLTMGNELLYSGAEDAESQAVLMERVARCKEADGRHWYCCTAHPHTEGREDDFYVSAWPKGGTWENFDEPITGIRWSGFDVVDSSRFNLRPPETVSDYRAGIAGIDKPLITHEVGQWAVYPDVKESPDYTGVFKAYHLDIIRQFMNEKGTLALADDFVRASAQLSLLLYKEEIESALRTPGLAGFQLLGFHDHPPQGTSTIGIVTALRGSKGIVTPAQFRQFGSETVPLARLPKRTYTKDETFTADIDVAHSGANRLEEAAFVWSLKAVQGAGTAEGVFAPLPVPCGELTRLGTITADFSSFPAPTTEAQIPYATRGCFTTLFWNPIMKRNQKSFTMGILCDPGHPALAGFPTEFHTNWQWWDVLRPSRVLDLDEMRPQPVSLVRMIDSFIGNRALSVVCEARGRSRNAKPAMKSWIDLNVRWNE